MHATIRKHQTNNNVGNRKSLPQQTNFPQNWSMKVDPNKPCMIFCSQLSPNLDSNHNLYGNQNYNNSYDYINNSNNSNYSNYNNNNYNNYNKNYNNYNNNNQHICDCNYLHNEKQQQQTQERLFFDEFSEISPHLDWYNDCNGYKNDNNYNYNYNNNNSNQNNNQNICNCIHCINYSTYYTQQQTMQPSLILNTLNDAPYLNGNDNANDATHEKNKTANNVENMEINVTLSQQKKDGSTIIDDRPKQFFLGGQSKDNNNSNNNNINNNNNKDKNIRNQRAVCNLWECDQCHKKFKQKHRHGMFVCVLCTICCIHYVLLFQNKPTETTTYQAVPPPCFFCIKRELDEKKAHRQTHLNGITNTMINV